MVCALVLTQIKFSSGNFSMNLFTWSNILLVCNCSTEHASLLEPKGFEPQRKVTPFTEPATCKEGMSLDICLVLHISLDLQTFSSCFDEQKALRRMVKLRVVTYLKQQHILDFKPGVSAFINQPFMHCVCVSLCVMEVGRSWVRLD